MSEHIYDYLLRKLFERTKIQEKGCWLWFGAISSNGYGSIRYQYKNYLVHRLSYIIFKDGNILDNQVVDHLCGVRNCVHPKHLEAVSQRTNVLRIKYPVSHNSVKTHCINGHKYTEETIRRNNGRRNCKLCDKIYRDKYREQTNARRRKK